MLKLDPTPKGVPGMGDHGVRDWGAPNQVQPNSEFVILPSVDFM